MAAKKACESFSKSFIEEVQKWGCMKQTGVSLRYMLEFGSKPTDRNLLISGQFLHKELPIRIARRAIELETLPYGLSEKPAVLKVSSFSFNFMSWMACSCCCFLQPHCSIFLVKVLIFHISELGIYHNFFLTSISFSPLDMWFCVILDLNFYINNYY